MKIVSIKFLNLNSLQGEHEIRFDREPFTDSGLFAIIGPTGAGKTTLLDAITIALYGQVHRHDKEDPSEIMTRHTGESYAEVEFEVKDKRYRAKWSNYRARKKPEAKLQGVKMELADVATGEMIIAHPLPEVQKEIIQACGLDYNQFIRSVMLSQGDFTRFLKANENDRSDLLEKITDTGIYSEISTWVFKEAKQKSSILENLRGRLQNVVLLSEEELAAYQEALLSKNNEAGLLKRERDGLAETRQWLIRLASLRARQQQLQHQMQVSAARYETEKALFHKLALHRQALKHQPLFLKMEAARKQVSEAKEKLAEIESTLPPLQQKLNQLYTAIGRAGGEAETARTALQEALPIIGEVERKDVLIEGAREQRFTDQQTLQEAQHALEETEKETAHNEELLQKTRQQVEKLTAWLEQHRQEAELVAVVPELNTHLGKLDELQQRAGAIAHEQQQCSRQEEQTRKELVQLEQNDHDVQQQLSLFKQHQQRTHTELKTALNGKTLEAWETEAALYPSLINICEQQYRLAIELKELEKAAAQTAAQREVYTCEHAAETRLLAGLKEKFLTAETLLTALQENVELQILIQKYEADRHALRPGKACPLCGAVHHPYIENHYTHERSEAEKKRDAQKKQVAECSEQVNAKHLLVGALQTKLDDLQKQAEQRRLDETEARQRFEANNILLPRPLDTEKAGIIESVIARKREDWEKLKQVIRQVRMLEKQIQEQEAALAQLNEKGLKIFADKRQTATQLENILSSVRRLARDLEAVTLTQQDIAARATYLLAPYGVEMNPSAAEDILQELKNRFQLFSQSQKDLHTLQLQEGQLKSNVEHGRENITEKALYAERLTTLLSTSTKRLEQLLDERFELFGEKDPFQEKKQLEREVQSKRDALEQLNGELSKITAEKLSIESQQRDWAKQVNKQQQAYQEALASLMAYLQADGIASAEALQAQYLAQPEADHIAQLQNRLDKERDGLQRSLLDNETELELEAQKNKTEQTLEKIQQQLESVDGAISGLDQAIGRINEKLHADKNYRSQHAVLAGQIDLQQKECDRWNQLSELIGSDNGKKFSRFAQGLTLARLTELANRHLLKLSDRYRIVKSAKSDLELLIIDGYQADVVRPMSTLSGGESFLVSLALALGLSDLASRKVQINSLFIDEGFGTLDAETLDTAISALENLQANGKTIGIISHVEALKERIGTQIQLSKQPGGSSTIKIVGYNGQVMA